VSDPPLDPAISEAELQALGLYDPDADDAAERLALLRLSIEHGATPREMRRAIDEDRLLAIAPERVLQGGAERLTLDDAMARAGIDPELGRRAWRALGFVEPAEDDLVCSERDATLFETFLALEQPFGRDAALAALRTIGSAMARIADNDVSSARSVLEVPIRSGGGTALDVSQAFVAVAESLVPALYPMHETVHRHHLVDASRRYGVWGVAPSEHQTSNAVVGFADVVGFTALTQRSSPEELQVLIRGFENRAIAATTLPGARLVKTIGDEVMYVAGTTTDAVMIARRLLDDPKVPPLRVGLAAGEIVTRQGDVFGPVVNLAARLVGFAEPDQIVCDAEAARRLDDEGGASTPLGAETVHGFDAPVDLYAVNPVAR
jgi:adenylate cyclase